jgi:DNA-binding transcriptional ArsR family regulator
MIKTYVRVVLCSDGESPKQVIERMRKVGAVPVVGDYDFELTLEDDERLFDKLEDIHRALRGSGASYTVTTQTGAEASSSARTRKVIGRNVDLKPVEIKKSLFKAKIERWRDMGLDVSELEAVLEEDPNKFREVSKDFLRTHLDKLSVVKDVRQNENQVDGEILALLDESGKTISELARATGYFEDQVVLSLGRLISSGSAKRDQRGSVEIYCMVAPPAPAVRKTIELVPAKDDEDARRRVLEAIPKDGASAKDVIRSAKVPREQFMKAMSSLISSGIVKRVQRSGMEFYYRT